MKSTFLKFCSAAAAALLCMSAPTPANAALIIGGSSLLTPGYASQLEAWLGEGTLTLTNIYTGLPGSSPHAFHAAADGMGRTFTIMGGTDRGITSVVGGYNPQSWSSSDLWHMTPADADRTAFLFNLSTGALNRQRLSADDPDGSGAVQTFNFVDTFPLFGAGWDLYVNSFINGGSLLRSYASPDNSDYHRNLFSNLNWIGDTTSISSFEVFTIASEGTTSVPEPSTIALIGMALLSMLGFGVHAKRRLVNGPSDARKSVRTTGWSLFAAMLGAFAMFGPGAAVSSASVFNTTTDFSLAANPNGAWAYGKGTGGSTFSPFTNSTSALFGIPVLEAWTDAATWPFVAHNTSPTTLFAFGWFVPTDFLDLHPGSASLGSDAIVQWTAPAAGAYSYTGAFQPLNGANITVTNVFLNSTLLHSFVMNGPLANFSGLLSLNPGDRLSFAVNNGGGFGGESTGLKATIQSVDAVPEPSAIALMAVAMLSLLALGVSRRRDLA